MATLILGTVGAIFGGPLGAVLGQAVGSSLDAKLFGKAREGARLADLAATTSSYGIPIPRQFGRMRTAGQIIWATDLVEHRDKHGNGKGKPSTVTYSYTASFAVALSSRPIAAVGRIWADGKLLRGAAGDLKTGGSFRVYLGHGDQQPDPLIAAAEGIGRTPAHRGIAFALFEDLQLGDFGNRIPALTFEVIADFEQLSVSHLLDEVVPQHDSAVPLNGLAGIASDGPLIELLQLLDPVFPVDCDATGEKLTIRPERHQVAPIPLPQAAVSRAEGDFGGNAGYAFKRAPETEQTLGALRYYDPDRDYLPGSQRAIGRPSPGQPRTLELPATLAAADARLLIDAATRRGTMARQTLSWRVSTIDPRIAPGVLVTVPGYPGTWCVREWEWHTNGVDLQLQRLAANSPDSALPADSGRANPALDNPAASTQLAAVELPWDGNSTQLPPQILAVASSPGAGWSGAALYVDQGDGALSPLGPTGRHRSVIGLAETILPPATPLLFDRQSTVIVELAGSDLTLPAATPRQLAMGANRALLGGELIQFQHAEPLGAGRWKLSGLWRGRWGTERAVNDHVATERFILLDGSGTLLDAQAVGGVPGTTIAALGIGDTDPVTAPIALRGIGFRPLTPVHGRAAIQPDGSLILSWVRRARGAWTWDDGVDTPLNEQFEHWRITYGAPSAPVAQWETSSPQLSLSLAELNAISALAPGEAFRVVQQGDRGVSDFLTIPIT